MKYLNLKLSSLGNLETTLNLLFNDIFLPSIYNNEKELIITC